jgi:soluble lytic murein transglycosylase-like protein
METLMLYFLLSTAQNNLPPNLLPSICYVESKYNPKAIHLDDGPEDSLGVCQLHLSTARLMGFKGKKSDLLNPEINIKYAGKYLKHQLIRYHGDVNKAIIAYNKGSAKQLTTSKYQRTVISEWRMYENKRNFTRRPRP